MAIINCPECNGKLSTGADACPHCGFALRAGVPPPINVDVKQESPGCLGGMSQGMGMGCGCLLFVILVLLALAFLASSK